MSRTEQPPLSKRARDDRAVGAWLVFVAVMVFIMVVIGGMTRLTESGLSITDWRPLLGWLPPLSEAEWQAVFERYKQFPEYSAKNAGMDLAGFKGIFWLEYIHRVWGRLIGLAFALPLLWLAIRGRVRRELWPRLIVLFVLGGLQGALGWFMVQSGLVDRPSVSQYRLAAHLGLAVVIFGVLLWIGWGLRAKPDATPTLPAGLRKSAVALFCLVCVTIVAGAFVAGLDAGLIYNEFPWMGEGIVPTDLWQAKLGLLNMFENRTTVQFQHRVLGVATVLAALVLWGVSRFSGLAPADRLDWSLVFLASAGQAFLGVVTLLLFVPVWAGTAHQGGALVLFTVLLYILRKSYPPKSVPARAATPEIQAA